MHDDCRARWSNNLVGSEGVDAVLVDDIAIAHYGVGRFGQLHRALIFVAVENHDYIVPLIAKFFQVLVAICNQAITINGQKLKMLGKIFICGS